MELIIGIVIFIYGAFALGMSEHTDNEDGKIGWLVLGMILCVSGLVFIAVALNTMGLNKIMCF